ncbi:hypothetical protein HYV11_03865 [Candidatus Dependentiae bacterium]|nr:hypothetical protein [Candidatus Dependentiae bacterium]
MRLFWYFFLIIAIGLTSSFDIVATEISDDFYSKLKEAAGQLSDNFLGSLKKDLNESASSLLGANIESFENSLDLMGASSAALKKLIKLKSPISKLQKNKRVTVKQEVDLSVAEKNFIKNRLKYVTEALQDHFEIDQPLRLAFSCSGGGNRALIGSLGLFIAAARHKFLDASMYVTGLSGSTWLIAPWSYMYYQGLVSDDLEVSLEQVKEMLKSVLDYSCPISVGSACPPNIPSYNIQMALANNLAMRFAYNQQITLVDFYGGFVGNFALKRVGDDRLDVTWSSIAKLAEKGVLPLPLCSSVFDIGEKSVIKSGHRSEYEWFETGPFEAGSPVLGFIPVWALGSTFYKGKMSEQAPEYPLSFYLGLYGSAFAISINDMINKGLPSPSYKIAGINVKLPIDTWIRLIIDQANKDIRAKRPELIHAQFPNFSMGLPSSALRYKKTFGQFDGGIYFNIPLPLLFDRPREVDVVIMYDSNPADIACLIDSARYFKRKNIAMPDTQYLPRPINNRNSNYKKEVVNKEALLSQAMTVFNDPRSMDYDSALPTLIYFPTPKTDISKAPYRIDLSRYPGVTMPIDISTLPYATTNFRYTRSNIENLVQTMQAIFESKVDEMKDILKLVAQKKYQKPKDSKKLKKTKKTDEELTND